MTEVTQVTEYRHEPFRLEREGVDVELIGGGDRGVCNVLVDDLVCEEGGYDGEEPGDDFVGPDDVIGN